MNEPMIVSDPKVMMGKPVVAGTRITVDLILEKLGSGEFVEAVIESHPRLTREWCWLPSGSLRKRFGLKSSTPSAQSPREPGRR
jgi:hypothetical protein